MQANQTTLRAPALFALDRLARGRRWLAVILAGGLLAACIPQADDYSPRRTTSTQTQTPARSAQGGPTDIDPTQIGRTAPVRVALLVPLTGEHQFIGQALQRAAEMAVFETGGQNFNLIPIDTGGTPSGAASAASQAISRGAELIIGPLFADSVQAVRISADSADIPVIAFSTDPSVAGGNVYLLSFLARPQVSRILDFAGQQGVSSVAILAPDNAYGRNVVEYAQQAMLRLNVRITRTTFYDPSAEDLRDTVQAFTNTVSMRRANNRARSLRAVRSSPLEYDAVLLPDGGQRLRSVAAILAFYDVSPNEVRFLGTGLWDSETVRLEQNLHGGWFAGPPPGARNRFIRKYRQAYDEDPPRIASLAYDAVALAASLARQNEPGQRYSHFALTNPSGFLGIDGIFRFGQDNLSDRGVAVMEVTEEEFRLIGPAPLSFEPGTN